MSDHVLSFTVNANVTLPDGRVVPQAFNANLEFPLADGRTLVQGPLTYNSDGLATQHNADFRHDPRFAEAYSRGLVVPHPYGGSLHIEWRVYIACWLATNALRVPGDFVECGVATGILSRAICSYVSFERRTDRTFWLLDTFEGYPGEQANDAERASGLADHVASYYTDTYESVRESFAAYPNVRLVKGTVPGTLPIVTAEHIAYLSIDMNAAAPEVAAMEAFWDRLSPGAFVLMDDYGWAPCINQKIALDAFAERKGVTILALPSGQGLLIRP
jgi:O-methyltransferase